MSFCSTADLFYDFMKMHSGLRTGAGVVTLPASADHAHRLLWDTHIIKQALRGWGLHLPQAQGLSHTVTAQQIFGKWKMMAKAWIN